MRRPRRLAKSPGEHLRRALRGTNSSDAGLGLVELLVGMAVASVVLVTLASVYLSSLRTTAVVTAKTSATADAGFAADVIARRLRVAVSPTTTTSAVATADPGRIVFYASIARQGDDPTTDPVPTRVTYAYDTASGCLRETLEPGTGTAPYTYPSATARTTCLVRGAVTGGDTAMFTYFTTPTGPVATTTASTVRAVGVSLVVTQTSGSGTATTRAGARAVLGNVSS